MDKLEREAKYQDDRAKREPRQIRTVSIGDPIKASYDDYNSLLNPAIEGILGDVSGKDVLVYGCGLENAPFWFALRGANVIAIDISSESVRIAEMISKKSGTNIDFRQMNAERTSFADGCFDLIFGTAILHHLHIETSAKEIHRLLKVGGRAVFSEVMQGNLFLNVFRVLTPQWRTEDERPLTPHDLHYFENLFGNINIVKFCFLSLGYLFLARVLIKKYHERIVRFFSRSDEILLGLFPFFKRYCWICVMEVRKHEKNLDPHR